MGSEIIRLALLGSTGSIGRQTLEVVSAFPQHLQVVGLAAGQNEALLAQQVRHFQPRFVHLEKVTGRQFSEAVPLSPDEMACHPDVDVVVVATSGKAGLAPTLAALRAGKRVALANKEVLVMAGELVAAAAKTGKGELVPIDSEHSALWQCLRGEEKGIARLILTASGGAFRDLPQDRLRAVTAAEALHHPTWQMGRKVTIDSATLMNKGLETIEARWLFDTPLDKIEVVLHRESLIHS
ncbi:MAG: Gfo/Idh/MocA family oxidoreductase, partial [Chloroflexota bacterium]|nr:Gfo/Idh/MocA family oxidoreductase [Chloroflexota bacterium]